MGASTILEQRTVLVIDDDRNTQEDIFDDAFIEHGYNPVRAWNGSDGLEKAREVSPDLILLGALSQNTNSYNVCRTLSDDPETKNIPIIMMTMNNDLSSTLSSYLAGAKRHIVKPFRIEDLFDELEKTLRQIEISRDMYDDSIFDPRD